MFVKYRSILGCLALATTFACGDAPDAPCPDVSARPHTVHSLANACVVLTRGERAGTRYVTASRDGTAFTFRGTTHTNAARFTARASDLGTYLLRDAEGAYLVDAEGSLGRTTTLQSDVLLNDDAYVSPAEWEVEVSAVDATRFHLKNRATGAYVGDRGLTADVARAADVGMVDSCGCAPFPEMSLDATGTISQTRFADGTLFGIVDTHSHLFTNVGFGGGGVFHGAPYHRLGVEHALASCETTHGAEGRRDLVGYFYGGAGFDIAKGTYALIFGEVQEFNHETDGYPTFSYWPNARESYTHQTQYYRWVERAYLAGLRLLVQHATTNEILCQLAQGAGSQTPRYGCNDMVAVERTLDEVYALERYIDAQHGGPGLGWFRVVRTPAEARAVIDQGKLAVVLGIETSNLFDCFITPRPGFPACTPELIRERLEHVHARGVRAIFPVHKFDNSFTPGDGSRGFIEVGNMINSGHYSNFTTEGCPETSHAVFDNGAVNFGGLNMPREVYDTPGPLDFSRFETKPAPTLVRYVEALGAPPLEGDYCQNGTLTPLGETLITELMLRGMIVEIDHLPQRSYARALEMLIENDYPPAATHGSTAGGVVYALGGVSLTSLPRCGNVSDPGAPGDALRARFDAIAAQGAYRAQGFGFDFNGFAGGPRPRFGAEASCGDPQTNPITYPFASYAGDIELTPPMLGERPVDFNEEGMIHIGLLPELIEDARRLGVSDEDLEPIFRSAEGYIRMWERAESRGAALRSGL